MDRTIRRTMLLAAAYFAMMVVLSVIVGIANVVTKNGPSIEASITLREVRQ